MSNEDFRSESVVHEEVHMKSCLNICFKVGFLTHLKCFKKLPTFISC